MPDWDAWGDPLLNDEHSQELWSGASGKATDRSQPMTAPETHTLTLAPGRREVRILTFKFRVKDSVAGRHLARHAIACNQVWNFCVATQREAERRRRAGMTTRWPTTFDLIKLCVGVSVELGLHSDTVQTICRQFVASRDTHRRCPGFRASFGTKRALGWVPFVQRALKIDGDAAVYLKRRFRFWKSREIDGVFKAGAFVQDARGRWYVTFQCEVEDNLPTGNGEIGIDLGLKALATCSDGTEIPALRHYRQYEKQIAVAQRAGNKRRVKAIHAKIANARRHHLHVASSELAAENSLIAIGNVNAAKLAKTRMAKSVLDAGWSAFRHMLRYKLARRQAVYVEVDERYTSRTCSECRSLSGPKGIAGLGVRRWECSECGSHHDRDVNSARLILRAGAERRPPVVEILPFLGQGKTLNSALQARAALQGGSNG
jgi:transposase